jgi:hypothetical protein
MRHVKEGKVAEEGILSQPDYQLGQVNVFAG